MLKASNKISKSTLVADDPNFQQPVLIVQRRLREYCPGTVQCLTRMDLATQVTVLHWPSCSGLILVVPTSWIVWASPCFSLSHIWSFTFYIKSKGQILSLKEELQSLPWSVLSALISVLLRVALPSSFMPCTLILCVPSPDGIFGDFMIRLLSPNFSCLNI